MARVIQEQPDSKADRLQAVLITDALPAHVAVIMDGNGRWGLGRGMNREYGHRESVDAMRVVVKTASDIGLRYLSLFCFSTENIDRPVEEVTSLFALFDYVLDTEPQRLNESNVRIITSGMIELLPDPLPAKFAKAIDLTSGNTGVVLNLCVMYSGRSELFHAARGMAKAALAGELDLDRMEESAFKRFLYQPDIPDADLVIRTSGEQRLSNFLLWQMAYSELIFTDVLWPDFGRADFLAALLEYQQRSRRFGKV